MFCDKCGAEANEDAAFCPKCGHRIGATVEEPNAAVAPAALGRSRRALWIAAGVVLLLVVVGVVAGGIVMAQNRAASASAAKQEAQAKELRIVYEKVAAVDSATSVGINFRDYSSKVQDAQAAVDAYRAPDAQAKAVVSDLTAALDLYKLANTYWNAAIQSSGSRVDNATLSAGWQAAGTSVDSARQKLEAYEKK